MDDTLLSPIPLTLLSLSLSLNVCLFLSLPFHHLCSLSSLSSSSSVFPFPLYRLVTGKPFFVVSSFYHRWLFGWTGCRFYGWTGFFFGCGSLITMTVVSLDRYLKICHLKYGTVCHESYIKLFFFIRCMKKKPRK